MSTQLKLKIVGMEDSDALSFTSAFYSQIACGHLWQLRDRFLTEIEASTLYPKRDAVGEEEELTPVYPRSLKNVFIKVSDYLLLNQSYLPLVHSLSADKSELEDRNTYWLGSFGQLTVKNSQCWIQGDTYFYDEFNNKGLRNKFHVKNYPNEPDNIDFWLEVKNPILIDDKLYYMRTITKYQQFKSDITDVISYCDKAIAMNKNVFWTAE